VHRAVEQKSLDVMRYALVKCLTLATSVALWGVLLAFTIHYQYFFVFLVVAFVAALLQYPQKHDIENAAPDFEAHPPA
jgi:hypothetical protein